MKIIVPVLWGLLQAAQPAAGSIPGSLTEVQQRDLSCVAALAIVASEQERGVESALDYPLLTERGQTYAGLVGEQVIKETGWSREQVRDAILAAVADHQLQVKDAPDPETVVESAMALCLPLLDKTVPPKTKPDLNQCAAMVELAYREVYGREGLSKTAKDLKTLASVLDSRAREQLRAGGYSGNESDIILTQLREEMLAEAREKETRGEGSNLDFDHCFALAAPEKKGQPIEH